MENDINTDGYEHICEICGTDLLEVGEESIDLDGEQTIIFPCTVCDVRRQPTNCIAEPPYPNHETVLFSIRQPDSTMHRETVECKNEHPHLIGDCRLF